MTELQWKIPTRENVGAIANVVIACELAASGEVSTTSGDILEFWEDEDVHLQTDTRVLTTTDGTIIAYVGFSEGEHGFWLDVHTSVHPDYQGQGLEHELLQFVEERARQRLSDYPELPHVLRATSFQHAWTHLLEHEGFTVKSSEWRLQIVLQEAPPEPESLEGISIRRYLPGQEEHEIYSVVQEAFQDIGDHPSRSFEEWEEGVLKRSSFDPSMLYVALDGDSIVGVIICRSYPEQQEGYVHQLAVRAPWRRRGIARQLLLSVFHEYYERGAKTILLSVGTRNATGAQELYRHVGMRRKQRIDELEKLL